jgi:two-component system chemotaxis response regulator CheY
LEKPGKALSIIKLGTVENYNIVKNSIEEKLEGKKCRVLAKKMSANGIKQIQINLTENKSSDKNQFLVLGREEREKNVILTVDDDLFVRKTLSSLLSENAEVHEVENATRTLEAYKQYNPDVVILDIHMPEINGLELLTQILEIDPDAYVIMSSSDSVKENVLKAIDLGAIGFLVKPIQKERIEAYLEQCITYNPANTDSHRKVENL